jgi:hypothetical protein
MNPCPAIGHRFTHRLWGGVWEFEVATAPALPTYGGSEFYFWADPVRPVALTNRPLKERRRPRAKVFLIPIRTTR